VAIQDGSRKGAVLLLT